MFAHHFIQQAGEFPDEPGQLFIGALHPHGLHPLFMVYEGVFGDLLSYGGELGEIFTDALYVFEAQRNDMGAFQGLDIFCAAAPTEKAFGRPANFSFPYKPGRDLFIILVIETAQQA